MIILAEKTGFGNCFAKYLIYTQYFTSFFSINAYGRIYNFRFTFMIIY